MINGGSGLVFYSINTAPFGITITATFGWPCPVSTPGTAVDQVIELCHEGKQGVVSHFFQSHRWLVAVLSGW